MGTLVDPQAAIVDERARRGFTTDPVRLLALLNELDAAIEEKLFGADGQRSWKSLET